MKTKYLKLSLLAVLVAGATMIISCEKEDSNDNSTLSKKSMFENPCGHRPDIDGPFTRGETVNCPNDNLPWYCNYQRQGNCLKGVTVPGISEQLDMVVSGGPDLVGEFFSGKSWTKIWPDLDYKIVNELATGKYYLHKIQRAKNNYFYIATMDKKLTPESIIFLVMPIVSE